MRKIKFLEKEQELLASEELKYCRQFSTSTNDNYKNNVLVVIYNSGKVLILIIQKTDAFVLCGKA